MGKTITEILSWVDETVPNKIATTSKQRFIQDLLGRGGDVYKYNTELVWQSTATVADQNLYDMPAGVQVRDITYLEVSGTTYNSTDVLGTTTPFTEYKFHGLEDAKVGNRYTNFTTQLSITPTPEDAYHYRYLYKPAYVGPYTATSDSTTVLNMDSVLIEYIQNKVAARVCKSGSFPRIDLGNNYEIEAESKLSNAKMNYYNLKHRTQSKRNISYKAWW